jgi:hypothetical protein
MNLPNSGEYHHLLNDDIGAEEDMGKTGSSGWIVLYNLPSDKLTVGP